jgi:hypothetical protein
MGLHGLLTKIALPFLLCRQTDRHVQLSVAISPKETESEKYRNCVNNEGKGEKERTREKGCGKGKEGRIEERAAANDELENESKGIGRALIHVLSQILSGGIEENTKSLRISVSQTKI